MDEENDKKVFMSPIVYVKEVSTAFQIDVEKFLQKFEQLCSFKYSDFSKIWREMNFTYVFCDSNYIIFISQILDSMYYIVKKFIVFPRSVYTQLGAFYMLYGLYFKQPIRNWVKIRLTLDEYKIISDLVGDLIQRQEFEPAYIFAKLKANNVFLYVANRRLLAPEDKHIKRFDFYYDDTFQFINSESSIAGFEDLMKSGDFESLMETDNAYQKALKAYSNENPSLACFESNFSNIFKEIKQHSMLTDPNSVQQAEASLNKRQILKNKAFATKNATYRASKSCVTASDIKIKKSL